MPTKPTQIRIPPATLELLDRHAAKEGVTRTAVILEAVERHLGRAIEPEPITDLAGELKTLRTQRRENEKVAEPVPDLGRAFKCPMHGCPFDAPSAAARCLAHGRLVVPK